jgi:hypothetical protein
MIIIGLIRGALGIGVFCWLLFTLAVYALPFSASLTAGLVAFHGGAGAIVVGIVAGAVTLGAGQLAFAVAGSQFIRAAIALLFATPAAVAGISCDACRCAHRRVVTRMARGVRNHRRDPRRRHGLGANDALGGPARER